MIYNTCKVNQTKLALRASYLCCSQLCPFRICFCFGARLARSRCSLGFLWRPMASYGLLWRRMASYGFLWLPMASFGFQNICALTAMPYTLRDKRAIDPLPSRPHLRAFRAKSRPPPSHPPPGQPASRGDRCRCPLPKPPPHSLPQLPSTSSGSTTEVASAGNRTRVTSMATMYSTTRPLMLLPPTDSCHWHMH